MVQFEFHAMIWIIITITIIIVCLIQSNLGLSMFWLFEIPI